jgi:hypothetical protein
MNHAIRISTFLIACTMQLLYSESTDKINAHPISSSFFEITAPGTGTIDKAGVYYLTSSIAVDEGAKDTPIIHIKASGVILDLNGFVLDGDARTRSCIIEIAEHVDWVTIKNGVLKNIDGCGIKISQNTSNIFLQDLCVTNVTGCGIQSNGTVTPKISHIFLREIATKTDSNHAILLQNCSNVILSHVFVTGNKFDKTFCTIKCIKCSIGEYNNIEISKIQPPENQASTTSTFTGILLKQCKNISFKNTFIVDCESHSTFHGIHLAESDSITILNSRIESCKSSDTFCAIKNEYGKFDNIGYTKVSGNICSTGDMHGVFLYGSEYSAIKHCDMLGNFATRGTSYGIRLGENDRTPSYTHNSLIDHNYFVSNTGANGSYGYYDASPYVGGSFTNNRSTGHGSVYTHGTTTIARKSHMNYWSSLLLKQPDLVREVGFDGINELTIEKYDANLSILDNKQVE